MLDLLSKQPIETQRPYSSWLEFVKQLASGKARAGLTIKGSLSLAMLRIRSLPACLTVLGDLDLQQCQRLSSIGDELRVVGNLLIGGKLSNPPSYQKQLKNDPEVPEFLRKLSCDNQLPLKSLPENLEVEGDLIIRGATALKSLPKSFLVGGSLFLSGCDELEELPESLFLTGDLILISCPKLRSLPKNLTAKRLILVGCAIEELPDTMDIEEAIHIESCPNLTYLPTSLICFAKGKLKRLVIDNCPIETLPDFISVTKLIRLSRLPIKVIKESFLSARSISIKKCKNLAWISGLLSPEWALSFSDCKKLQGFSAPLRAFQVLDLRNCESLRSLPDPLQLASNAYKIVLTNCAQLTQLPENTEFKGRIEVSGCGLKGLPPKMRKCNVLWAGHWTTPDVIFYPETLTPERILTEPNAEIRRLMLEKVGIENILKKANVAIIHQDKDLGGDRLLIEVTIVNQFRNRQKARYLRCSCPSTARQYLLPVPPNIGTCHNAAAWLAGFNNPDDYQPVQET